MSDKDKLSPFLSVENRKEGWNVDIFLWFHYLQSSYCYPLEAMLWHTVDINATARKAWMTYLIAPPAALVGREGDECY